MTKPENYCCKLPLNTPEEDNTETVSLAAAKKIIMDAVVLIRTGRRMSDTEGFSLSTTLFLFTGFGKSLDNASNNPKY